MTKPGDTTDPDKYIYSGYGFEFDRTGQFTHPQVGMARNVIILGVNSSNKTQNILILGHGSIQKVNNTTIDAEKMYSPNFSAENKRFCLSLHYNGDGSYLFVNGKESLNLKPKNLKLKETN